MKTSQTGMFFDYHHRRDDVVRARVYEHKKTFLRERLARWPQMPPDDLAAMPESVKWWWRTLDTLRNEVNRTQRGVTFLRTLYTPRLLRANLLQLKRTA